MNELTWLIASGGALLVVCAVVTGVRLFRWRLTWRGPRRVVGRHRATRADKRSGEVDRRAAQEVPEVEDVELAISPRTGHLLHVGTKRDKAPADLDREPLPRVGAHDAPVLLDVPHGLERDTTAPDRSTALPGLNLNRQRRQELLRQAWTSRDMDALAAQAASDPDSQLAGYLMAGHLGQQAGNAQTGYWLGEAFGTGQDPQTDELLHPYLDQLVLTATFGGWGVHLADGCTRESLGLAAAAAEADAGDWDGAYGTLLQLPGSTTAGALRGLAELELGWWARAKATARRKTDEDEHWRPVFAFVLGAAHAGADDHAEAVAALETAILLLEDNAEWGVLLSRALFLRSTALRALDRHDEAWEDLTRLVQADPDFPGATEALKSL